MRGASVAAQPSSRIRGGLVCNETGKASVVPSRSTNKQPRAYDRHQARHLIENFFAKPKRYRAIAIRYDKTARNFLGAIHRAAAVIWLD